MQTNKYVLIVDPFSSGACFAKRIKSLFGYNVIALITNDKLPKPLLDSLQAQDYLKIYKYKSEAETMQEIEADLGKAPDFMVCGSEPGVQVFDQLCKAWDILPNIFNLSAARRDKYLMQHQLKLDGINYIPHYKSGNLQDTLSWCEENPFNEYVIKPINSFGTDGVYFCKTKTDIENAFNSLINNQNYLGVENSELLIEKKIEGTEYVVDAVSSNGKHYVVAIFRYIKREVNGAPIYHQMVLESLDDHPNLISYINQVLTSLGICHGPSHSELIISDSGPVLVETGARMHGGLGPQLIERCNSHSIIDLGLLSRISPSDFADKTQTPPTLKSYAIEYFLSSPVSGTLDEINIDEQCSTLASYSFSTCNYKVGDHIKKTTDLVTSYGRVVLINSDRTQLTKDADKITELEANKKLITVTHG